MNFELMMGLLLGIGLSAASGFRLFIPPLVLSAAALYFGLPLPGQVQWLGTETAFFILLTATVFEIGAYYVPWLDNLLDTVATPAAVIAGTLITSPFISQLDPFWQWTLALVAGGAAAGAVQSMTNVTRFSSTAVTGGLANPVVATLENITSLFLSILVVVFPVVSGIILIMVGYLLLRLARRMKRRPIGGTRRGQPFNPW